MRGYLVFTVLTEALRPTSGLAVNPQVGPIFGVPLGYLEFFTWQSTTGPREVPELKVRERPPSTLRPADGGPPGGVRAEVRERPPSTLGNVDDGPPGGVGAGDPGAPTINAKKHRRWALGRCQSGDPGVPTINLKNVNDGPLGGAGAGDLRAPTINAKKHRWRPPWEVLELEIWERPLSTLRNIDDDPLGGADGDPGAPTMNVKNIDAARSGRCRS
jgi:hypothetical protein